MDFAPWGQNPMLAIPVDRVIRYDCGDGEQAGQGWQGRLFLAGTLGRYGIKSDARAVLRMNSGITSDAITGATRVTAYDAKNAIIFTGG